MWSAGLVDGSWVVAISVLFVAYATIRLHTRPHELGLALIGSGCAALLVGVPSLGYTTSLLPLGLPALVAVAGVVAFFIGRLDPIGDGPLLAHVKADLVFESDGVQFVVFPPQGPISRKEPGQFVVWAINVMSTSRAIRLEPEEGRDHVLSESQLRFAAAHPVSLKPGQGAQVVLEVTPCPTVTKRFGYLFATVRVAAMEGTGVRARVRRGCEVAWPTIAHRQVKLGANRAGKATWFGHQVELRPEPFYSPPPPRSHVRVLSGRALSRAIKVDLDERLADECRAGRRGFVDTRACC